MCFGLLDLWFCCFGGLAISCCFGSLGVWVCFVKVGLRCFGGFVEYWF